MPVTISSLMATIGIDDSAFRAGLARAEQAMETFGNQLKAAGEGLSKVVTAPIVALAAAALKAGGDIDEAFDAIAIKTGATGQKLEGLQQSFRGVFGNVTQGAGEVGGALGLLNARTGMTGVALERLTKQSLDLARLQGTDLTQTISDVTRFFGDASISVNQQSAAMDFLFRVSQKTGTTVDALTQKMVFYGAPLRQMGIGWQQSALLMGKWEKEGVNTELVMGSLRIALMKFATQGIKEPAAALPILIEKIKEAKTQGEATAIAMTYFGARAGADMAAAIREGRFAIGDLVKSMKETGDGIEDTTAKTDDWREHLTKLWHEVIKTVEPVGTQMFNAVTKIVDVIKGPLLSALSSAVKWWTALGPGVQTAIMAFAVGAAAIGPILFAVGALTLALAPLLPALGTIAAFMLGPWGLAIGAAVAAVYLMTTKGARNMTEWMNNIKVFFAWAKPFFVNSWEAIKDVVVGVWKVLEDVIGGAIQIIYHNIMFWVKLIQGDWRGAWDEIKSSFAAFWDSLVDLVTQALPRLVVGIKNLLKGIWGAVTGGTKEQVAAMNKQVAADSVQGIAESLADQHLQKMMQKSGAILGETFVGGLTDSIGIKADKQAADSINKILNKGIEKKKPHDKQTEGQRLAKELAAQIDQVNAQVAAMEGGAGAAMARLRAHFRKLGPEAVEPLLKATERLKNAMAYATEVGKWKNAMEEVKAKIVELKTAGLGIREALDFTHPVMASTKAGRVMLDGLAKEMRLHKELAAAAKLEREQVDKRDSQVRSERSRVTELQAEYLKLSHIRQEDQFALETTGQLFEDLDADMQGLIGEQMYWANLVKDNKDHTAELRREDELTKQVTASIAKMRHEITLRDEATEEGLGKKRAITPFANLPEADQMAEIDQWMDEHKVSIDKMTLADVSLARAELAVRHELDAKKQSDQDAAEVTRKSTQLTEALRNKLAETHAELASIRGEAPKHSAMVAKLMADIQAGTLKLNAEQKKLFDAIVADETEAPSLRLTEEMKKKLGELTQQLDGLSTHKHSAYVRLLEDLKEHGKLTEEQITLLKRLEDAEDKVTRGSKQFDAMKQLAAGTKQVMTGFFTDIIEKGKVSFASIVQSFTQMLQKMAEEYLASVAIKALFGAFGYDETGVKIPHRATGGLVDGGRSYLVGEHGPELFTPPSSGNITPNSQLADGDAGWGGGGIVVHMTVNTPDANSFRLSNSQTTEDFARQLDMIRRRNG